MSVNGSSEEPESPQEEISPGVASQAASLQSYFSLSCFQRDDVKIVFPFLSRKRCLILFWGRRRHSQGNPLSWDEKIWFTDFFPTNIVKTNSLNTGGTSGAKESQECKKITKLN